MAKIRLGYVKATGAGKIRLGHVKAVGSALTNAKVRLGYVKATGYALSTVTPLDYAAIPAEEVALTFVVGQGQPLPDSITWAIQGGAAGSITDVTGLTANFQTPSVWPLVGDNQVVDITIRATPVVGGVNGAYVDAVIHTLPQTIFLRNPGDTLFSGVAPQPA